VSSSKASGSSSRPQRLFRLSDASGKLSFGLVKDSEPIQRADLDGNDFFLLDTSSAIWVWRGLGASKAEKAMWINVAQSYFRQLQGGARSTNAHLTPLASVVEGNESPTFLRAIEV
jgi:gelsolin